MNRLFSLALPLVLALPAVAQTPMTPTPLAGGTAGGPGGISVDGDRSAVMWFTNKRVMMSVSDDCGVTWRPSVQVNAGPWVFRRPVAYDGQNVQLHGDHVYCMWSDDRNGTFPGADIYFGRSVDGGVTWTEVLLDPDITGTAALRVIRSPVTPTQDRIHVLSAGVGQSNPDEALFFTTSIDGGATFGTRIELGPTVSAATEILGSALHTEGARVVVVWSEESSGIHSVHARVSDDSGVSFGPPIQLDLGGFVTPDSLSLGGEGDLIAAAWLRREPGKDELMHVSVSSDGGASFGPPKLAGNYSAPPASIPDGVVQVTSGNILALWIERRNGFPNPYEPFVSVSTDGGATFAQTSLMPGVFASFLQMVARGPRVALTMTHNVDDEILSFHSSDGGVTWTGPVQVSDLSASVAVGTLALGDADDVQVTWFATAPSFPRGEAYAGGYRTTAASVTTRSAGTNVASYSATAPMLGGPWSATVDLSTTGHPTALVRIQSSAATIPQPNGQFFLLAGALVFQTSLLAGPLAQFSTVLPPDPCLSGRSVFSQAAHLGGPGAPAFTNAQDLLIGTF